MKLDGAVVLVTGGAKRVGRAIVLELAGAGCRVAIHYHRSAQEAAELVAAVSRQGGVATAIGGDLNIPSVWSAIVEQTVSQFGGLDVLVNNASQFEMTGADTLDGFDLDRAERMLRTNLLAPLGLCQQAAVHLARSRSGKIVNLCDIWGDRPLVDHLVYSVSKAGLAALTKGLAKTLAPAVQVNGIAPGIAVFPESYSEQVRRDLRAKVPLQREGSATEVAGLVRYLVESGDYITGQIIAIDGGRSMV